MPNDNSTALKSSGEGAHDFDSQSEAAIEGCPGKNGWIEVSLVGDDDTPVADERIIVRLPNGNTEKYGKTDSDGKARITGLPEGECEICFPDIDESRIEALGPE